MFNNELWQKPTGGAAGGNFYTHQIANSSRFLLANSSYMHRTPSSAGNRRTWTFSTWIKRTKFDINTSFFGATRSGYENVFRFDDEDNVERLNTFGFTGSSADFNVRTTASYRDSSAWMHIVIAMDTTQGTASNRLKLYVNGEQQTDLANNSYPSQNYDTNVNDTSTQTQVGFGSYGGQYFDGYMAESVLIDGTQYAASDFGETKNGVWIPKDPSGLTFGTNGFYLKYESSSNLGNDSSGNNNDLTVSGLSAHDQMKDTPTFNSDSNGGNFMTYNGVLVGSNNTLSEGNLKSTGSGGGNASGTFGMLTGKWYWECRAETVNSYGPTFGIGQTAHAGTDGLYYIITWQTAAGQMYGGGGSPVGMGTITVTSTGVSSLSSGDILSFWLDCDNRKLWIGKNGTIPNSGNPANGTNPQASWASTPTARYFTPTCQNVGSGVGVLNAGQNPSFNGGLTGSDVGTATDKNGYGLFKYDPSSTDFIACCAANQPVPDAVDPAQTNDNYPQELFNTIIYTGDNGGSFTTGFQPDLVWVKRRDDAQSNALFDSSRGTTKILISNESDAEATTSGLTSFNTTGYTMGTSYNQTGNTYVSWSWRANGGSSSNSDGATSSTVQAAPGGGFSIVTYTGFSGSSGTSTVGHGMGVAPNMIIHKSRSRTSGWWTAAPGLFSSQSHFIDLNGTGAPTDLSSYGTISAPTSSVFSINGVDGIGGESATYVAYCFANIEGFCRVGTYAGNGSTDGTFVYTGFKPKFVLFKRTNRSGDFWYIIDPVRNPFNGPGSRLLNTDRDVGESGNATTDVIDILSNGFKLRTSGSGLNGSGGEWVYMAMAHNPFKYATAR